MFLDHPRGFRDEALVAERREMLRTVASVQPLVDWSEGLRARSGGAMVPHFDPAEAGVDTTALFVFEAPGPMTNADNPRAGSGFISVDNNDQTAANVWMARNAIGLHRGALSWNIVPWYLGNAARKPTAAELVDGARELTSLMRLLPDLRVVVLSGRYAQHAWRSHVVEVPSPATDVVEMWHPSPQSLNQPGRRAEFIATMRDVARLAGVGTDAAPDRASV